MKKNKRIKSLLIVFFVGSLSFTTGCLNDGDSEIVDPVEQYEKDQKALDAYIAEKGYTNVQQDTSGWGIRFLMVEEGTGEAPVFEDYMNVTYKGSLLDGTEFDSGDSSIFRLTQSLIPAWQILMQYLREGGNMIMFVPSFYGYKDVQAGDIPPNSPLIFDVTLHNVYDQLGYENFLIDEYIEENELAVQADTVENLKYIIEEEGSGEFVQPTDRLNVSYIGKYVEDEAVFTNQSEVTINLNTYAVEGWKIILPYAKVGSTVTMFIPSDFAYGATGSVSVQGDRPLIYTVTINSVVEE